MSHRTAVTALILVVALSATLAYAGPANLLHERAASLIAAAADVPAEPSSVIAAGDFNHDGIADLVEVILPGGKNAGQRFLTVRLGKRDGTFAQVASRNVVGGDPRALVVGDFNGDGNPDVIVGDGKGALSEFLGDGKGKLAPAGDIANVGTIVSMATGQFTRDEKLDLVISDLSSNKATILLGAGNGSFRRAWSFELPRRGAEFHIATADFNKDGLTDLVITTDDNADYEVMLGNGNGTFTYAPQLSHLRDPYTYCPS
jgi:hypothetical protein